MIGINRKNKLPKSRKFSVYKDGKRIGEVIRYQDWICIDLGTHRGYHMPVRSLVMRDLYWLIGDDCDADEWNRKIERLDNGTFEFDVPTGNRLNSVFDNIIQRELARNSINNSPNKKSTILFNRGLCDDEWHINTNGKLCIL
jgi:hypothetical protein